VLPAEHLLDLAGLDVLVERVEPLGQLCVDRFASGQPVGEHRQVFVLLAQRDDEIALLLDALAALQDLLGFDLVLPEFWSGGLGFYAGEFFIRFGGLKDSYADRQPGG